MPEETKNYAARLKEWAMYMGAILTLTIASALAQRWLGKEITLPAPPIIVVNPGEDGTAPVVRVLNRGPAKEK